jgi:hypothetical protein
MGGSAPDQDPNMGRAALLSARTGRMMLDWMREQANVTNRWAEEDRQRYQDIFIPMQDAFIREANTYDSPERMSAAADRAGADVALAARQQRGQMQRQLGAMGISPASGRAMGAFSNMAMDTALATAGARNLARRQVEDQARNMRAAAINMGQGLAVNPGTSMGLSNNAGQAGFGGAMQGYGQQANILNQDYNNRYEAWAARQGMLGGLASGLGTLGGVILEPLFSSSKDAKTGREPVSGALDAVRSMPVEQWTYKPGMGDGGTHVGPYAEDFQAATGMGDGKTIDVISALGVTMGAVQELADKVDDIAARKPARPSASGDGRPGRRASA